MGDSQFTDKCEIFIKLLQQWGKVHNLSGSLDRDSIMANIEDSIYPLEFIDDFGSFLDVGTGAGYPGMILAMARPNAKGYLVEPRAKRVAFLHFVKSTLGLSNLHILQSRVEDVKLDEKIDLSFMIKEIILDKNKELICSKFINSLVQIILDISNTYKNLPVVLSGGVFQNRILLKILIEKFQKQGREFYFSKDIPLNDGGISAGQIYHEI